MLARHVPMERPMSVSTISEEFKPLDGVDVGIATSVSDIIERAFAIDRSCGGGYAMPWYRGVGDADWPLIPQHLKRYGLWKERTMYTGFRKGAQMRREACPQDNDHARWLSLMQHYGMPTRLLDWTKSLLVAAFFVVWKDSCESLSSRPGAVWVTIPGILNENLTGSTDLYTLQNLHLCSLIFPTRTRTGLVCAVEPVDCDIRMMVQQSSFTVHDNEKPMEEIPEAKKALRRILIPAKSRARIKCELERCGVTRATLFPDLDNFSAYLKESALPVAFRPRLTSAEDQVRAEGKWFVAASKEAAKGAFKYPTVIGDNFQWLEDEAFGI
jgi:hypothetical protein